MIYNHTHIPIYICIYLLFPLIQKHVVSPTQWDVALSENGVRAHRKNSVIIFANPGKRSITSKNENVTLMSSKICLCPNYMNNNLISSIVSLSFNFFFYSAAILITTIFVGQNYRNNFGALLTIATVFFATFKKAASVKKLRQMP